jgi:hypothetical protein
MRLVDRKLIIGVLPWGHWSFGTFYGDIARWFDLGPLYIGWRYDDPCDR